jgi:hypothetical protein
VGVLSTLIGGAVGSPIGIIGGYLGGWADRLVMRLIDILLALPGLLLALIFIAALPRTLPNEIIAISVSTVPIVARVLRAQALQVRSRLFVDAATASGIRRITFDGQDWLAKRGERLRVARKDIQAIFQDPLGSLDPGRTAGYAIGEASPLPAGRGDLRRARATAGRTRRRPRGRLPLSRLGSNDRSV